MNSLKVFGILMKFEDPRVPQDNTQWYHWEIILEWNFNSKENGLTRLEKGTLVFQYGKEVL